MSDYLRRVLSEWRGPLTLFIGVVIGLISGELRQMRRDAEHAKVLELYGIRQLPSGNYEIPLPAEANPDKYVLDLPYGPKPIRRGSLHWKEGNEFHLWIDHHRDDGARQFNEIVTFTLERPLSQLQPHGERSSISCKDGTIQFSIPGPGRAAGSAVAFVARLIALLKGD